MTSPTFLSKLRRYSANGAFGSLIVVLAACAQTSPAPAAGESPLVISQSTNAALQQYLKKIYPIYGGAFAVSPDGANSFYVYCPDASCDPPLYGGIARKQCYSLTGQECVLFYVRDQPRRAYTVSTQKTSTGHHSFRRARPIDELRFVGIN